MHILWGDLDPNFQENHRGQLIGSGHAVTCVRTGGDVLQRLMNQRFDLVITDAGMPGDMTGIGLLKTIKSPESRWKHMPVLVFIGDLTKKHLITQEGGIFVNRKAPFNALGDAIKLVALEKART